MPSSQPRSFHWFDRPIALPEMARVLRPGGLLLIVWNVREEGVAWADELTRILDSIAPAPGVDPNLPPDVGPWFTGQVEAAFLHSHPLDVERLVGLVDTFSYVRLSPDRERVLAEVGELARTHQDLAGRRSFELRFRTRVLRSVRPD